MFATGGSFRALLRQPAVVAKRGPRRRVGWLAVVAALAVLSTAMVSSSAAAQAADGSDVVRIVARRLESGRVEFGLQQRQADESWGERRLPRVRFFPTTATVGSWLNSSPLSLPAGEVRIVARRLESGRVEFGLQQRQADESWGERRLPRVRFFPTTATVGRWLASSALIIRPSVTVDREPEPAAEPVDDPGDTVPPSTVSFSDVAAGNQHTCGLRTDGTVVCWGDSDFSSCGLVTAQAAFSLTIVCDEEPVGGYGPLSAPEGQFTAISSGKWHMCGIRADQRVQCWAWREANAALTDAPEGAFVAVAAAENHSCGIRVDGTAECWSAISVPDPCTVAPGTAVECRSSTSIEIDAPAGTFTAISSGGHTECDYNLSSRGLECANSSFSCGIRPDGTVVCWGSGPFGQTDPPLGTFSAVSAGEDFACGIRTGGTLACWGSGYFSDGTGPGPGRPPEGTFASISVGSSGLPGGSFACGVRTDGTAECWHPVSGRGDSPLSAPQGTFTGISAGHEASWYACGIRPDGTVDCWGENYSGEATPPTGALGDISVGASYACGVRTNGALTCWGKYGDEIGAHGDPPPSAFAAVSVGFPHACGISARGAAQCWANRYSGGADPPPGTFTAISAGGLAASATYSFSCGIRVDGTITCWGANDEGQTEAPGGTYSAIAAGGRHSCGIRTDGTITCWGNNYFRQATPPAGQFTAISAGPSFACGIRTDGTAQCWGQNEFNKADAPGGTFTAISAGVDHACGIRTDGTAQCWGKEGAEAPSGTFTDISAGPRFTCAIRTDGDAQCWGWTTAVPDGVRWVSPNAPDPSKTDPGQAPTDTELAAILAAEAEMARLVNELRESLGVAPLAYNRALASVARRWSQTMRDDDNFIHNPYFTHQYPPGWQQAAENIAWTPGPSILENTRTTFALLKNSPSHYANMVHPDFNQIGVGIAIDEHRLWVTQNFAYYPQ